MATGIDGLRVERQAHEAGLPGATLAGFTTITTCLAGAQPRALPDPLGATAANVLSVAKTAIMQFDAVLQGTGLPPTAANLGATTAIFLVPAAIGMVVGRTGTVAAQRQVGIEGVSPERGEVIVPRSGLVASNDKTSDGWDGGRPPR